MNNTSNIILIDQNTIVKSRIKDILAGQDMAENSVKIYEASNRREVINILAENKNDVDLIVSEIEIDPSSSFDGVDLIKLVKSKRSSIPIVILSSVSRKDVITQCFRAGAADYILKPFKDETLKQRIVKYINLETLTESTALSFNLKSFLDGEIYKAKKGKYPFTLMLVNFETNTGENSSSRNSFYSYSDMIYQELKKSFWKGDLYIQHGFQSHLGFFPFCDQNHSKIVINKISYQLQELKETEPNIENYTAKCSFATFPTSGETAQDLLGILSVSRKKNP